MAKKFNFKPSFLIVPRVLYEDKDLQLVDWGVYAVIYWMEKLKEGICYASNKTIADVINVDPRSVQNSMTRLEEKKYIKRLYKDRAKRNRIEIKTLVDFDVRNMSDTQGTSEKQMIDERKLDDRDERKLDDQSNNNINNNIKNAPEVQDGKGKKVNELMKLFEEVNPSVYRLYANKTQRSALERMLDRYGEATLVKIIRSLEASNSRAYFPTITTPYQLEANLGKLKAAWQKEKGKEKLGAVI